MELIIEENIRSLSTEDLIKIETENTLKKKQLRDEVFRRLIESDNENELQLLWKRAYEI